jgi:hypothetical protein
MCSNCILTAVFGALFAVLFFSAVWQQFDSPAIGLDERTLWLAGQYFVAFLLMGITKYFKYKACYAEGMIGKKSAKKR